MEYTDAPIESSEQPFAAPTPATGLLETAEGHASDLVAVTLSIVPGLGHVYKGYRLTGILLMFFGTPLNLEGNSSAVHRSFCQPSRSLGFLLLSGTSIGAYPRCRRR